MSEPHLRFDRRRRILAAGITLVVVACGNAGAPSGLAEGVAVKNIAFEPAALTTPAGTQVTWTSGDEGVAHTVTSGQPGDVGVPGVTESAPASPDGVFDGELADAGETFSFTFTEPGTYAYYCAVHPSMTGRIDVTG